MARGEGGLGVPDGVIKSYNIRPSMPLVQLSPLLKPADLAEKTFPLYACTQANKGRVINGSLGSSVTSAGQPLQRHLLYNIQEFLSFHNFIMDRS